MLLLLVVVGVEDVWRLTGCHAGWLELVTARPAGQLPAVTHWTAPHPPHTSHLTPHTLLLIPDTLHCTSSLSTKSLRSDNDNNEYLTAESDLWEADRASNCQAVSTCRQAPGSGLCTVYCVLHGVLHNLHTNLQLRELKLYPVYCIAMDSGVLLLHSSGLNKSDIWCWALYLVRLAILPML